MHTQGVFPRRVDETEAAFAHRMQALDAREYAQLRDVQIGRRCGWLDGRFVCVADVEHAPVVKTARRSRRGGKKHRARQATDALA